MNKGFLIIIDNNLNYLIDNNDEINKNRCINYFLSSFQINNETNTFINEFNKKYTLSKIKIKNKYLIKNDDYINFNLYNYTFENNTFKDKFNFIIEDKYNDIYCWFDDKLFDIIKEITNNKLNMQEKSQTIILYEYSYNKYIKNFITIHYESELNMINDMLDDCNDRNIKYISNEQIQNCKIILSDNGLGYECSHNKLLYLTVNIDEYINYIKQIILKLNDIVDIKKYCNLLTIDYHNLAKIEFIKEIF